MRTAVIPCRISLKVIRMPRSDERLIIIGAGLAGSEAAWQAAKRGIKVKLIEMRPNRQTPAHHTGGFAELVCSNSLRSDRLQNAVGLLKEEMRRLDSLIMRAADQSRVPAGGALAVDRDGFSGIITRTLSEHPNIEVSNEYVAALPEAGWCICATGPLTDEVLSADIQKTLGCEPLAFFDAAAPIVTAASLDMDKIFRASRYGRGDDYLNCPMTEDEYNAFYDALVSAETVPFESFEKDGLFEGCLPVESIAARGRDTLRFGPLKPIGLTDPKTGKRPYAVVQLRQDDEHGRLYNLVGFQTRLRHPEQKRVFGIIPGLEKADYARLGVMHRNTYIPSPGRLNANYMALCREGLFFAGQMTGVEGYVESAASGLVAGLTAARMMNGESVPDFGDKTCIGAMGRYISGYPGKNFQPMNAAFGLIAPLEQRMRGKKNRAEAMSERALAELDIIKEKYGI